MQKKLAIIIKVCYNVSSATIMLELSQDRKIAALIASYCVRYNCVLKRVPIIFIGILFLPKQPVDRHKNNVPRETLFLLYCFFIKWIKKNKFVLYKIM